MCNIFKENIIQQINLKEKSKLIWVKIIFQDTVEEEL